MLACLFHGSLDSSLALLVLFCYLWVSGLVLPFISAFSFADLHHQCTVTACLSWLLGWGFSSQFATSFGPKSLKQHLIYNCTSNPQVRG